MQSGKHAGGGSMPRLPTVFSHGPPVIICPLYVISERVVALCLNIICFDDAISVLLSGSKCRELQQF